MVITSDFDKKSYKSLLTNFGWQFLLFLICLLASFAILYGVEYKYKTDVSPPYNRSRRIERIMLRTEEFINGTGFSAIQEFSKTHNVHTKKLNTFVRELVKIRYLTRNSTRYRRYENLDTNGMTFLQAISLVFSTVTTVGWGHVVPVKVGGQALTCIIAIIGIPLTFIMIISGSHIIIRLSKDIIKKKFGINRVDILYKPLIVFLIFAYILITAGIIAKIEDFDYQSALWYSFMSLTTVGFGDVVQNSTVYYGREAQQAGVLIFQILWLIFGFILIGGLILSIVYERCGGGHTTQFHQILKNKSNDEELIDDDNEA